MTVRRRHITSAVDLRALAHPLRLDLLELLATRGPMTATDAASALEQTPANVSWHLRKLGEHGFVEQDASGPGRRRPWHILAQAHTWGEDGEDPTAVAALRDLIAEREFELLRTALARHDEESDEWRAATHYTQVHLWLTPDEARTIGQGILDLVSTYLERAEHPASRPPEARLAAVMGWVVPVPEPRTESEPAGEEQR